MFKFLFYANGIISYKWEKSSTINTNKACKRRRTDFVFITNDGLEIGSGEIKSPCTSAQLLEKDRARTSETLKQQLHIRIMKSKDPKEFTTFGVVFNGYSIELYVMAFDSNNDPPYQFFEVEKLKLPSSPDLYNNLEETVEKLISFKTSIISSLANESDITKPFIYSNYIHLFKPTIAFKND